MSGFTPTDQDQQLQKRPSFFFFILPLDIQYMMRKTTDGKAIDFKDANLGFS